jgi:guanine deaminase
MTFTEDQKTFMREAIRLSIENVQSGRGGPFGAVVVKKGEIIARGVNSVTAENDPTAHAEINAIREACKVLETFQLDDCEIYSSCEPCPMCLGAIYWARPAGFFYGNSKADAAQIEFDDAFIYKELELAVADRQLRAIRLLPEEAKVAFDLWITSADKIRY